VSVVVPYQAPNISGNFLGVQDVYNITASNAWALYAAAPVSLQARHMVTM